MASDEETVPDERIPLNYAAPQPRRRGTALGVLFLIYLAGLFVGTFVWDIVHVLLNGRHNDLGMLIVQGMGALLNSILLVIVHFRFFRRTRPIVAMLIAGMLGFMALWSGLAVLEVVAVLSKL
jgi:hypothetical protein